VNFANVKSITIPEGDVKSIAIGGVTVWEKPNPLPYDAEVEYVETEGDAYVNTGVYLASTSSVFATFSNCLAAIRSQLFGARSGFQNKMFSVQYTSPETINFNFGDTQSQLFNATIDNAATSIVVQNGVLTFGPYTIDRSSTPAFLTEFQALILSMNNGGVPNVRYAGLRCHGFRIEHGGVLVRDYAPVRVGTAGYLYDRANPTGGPLGNGLYGSATATPLVAGPDKNGGAA